MPAVPFIAGLLPARVRTYAPRARARKPENRREEDENGIRETVGGEEAGKAGSRFRRGVGTRACRRSKKRERTSDIARREREIERRIDKKSTANADKWPNDHGGLTRALFPRPGAVNADI